MLSTMPRAVPAPFLSSCVLFLRDARFAYRSSRLSAGGPGGDADIARTAGPGVAPPGNPPLGGSKLPSHGVPAQPPAARRVVSAEDILQLSFCNKARLLTVIIHNRAMWRARARRARAFQLNTDEVSFYFFWADSKKQQASDAAPRSPSMFCAAMGACTLSRLCASAARRAPPSAQPPQIIMKRARWCSAPSFWLGPCLSDGRSESSCLRLSSVFEYSFWCWLGVHHGDLSSTALSTHSHIGGCAAPLDRPWTRPRLFCSNATKHRQFTTCVW